MWVAVDPLKISRLYWKENCYFQSAVLYCAVFRSTAGHQMFYINNNNNHIFIALCGRNFRGAGSRSDQCSI